MELYTIVQQIVQLFIVMSVGYFLMFKGFLNEEINKKLSSLVLSVTTPALILSSMTSSQDVSQGNVILVLLIALATYMILPILSYIVVRVMGVKQSERGLFMFMTIFSNTGFMGYPIMQSLFGNTGVFYTALFNMIFNIAVYTIGLVLIQQDKSLKEIISIRNIVTPGIVASILALFLYFMNITLPITILNSAQSIGSMTTPLAMIIIGASLTKIKFKDLLSDLKIYPYTFIKQIGLPIICLPLLSYFVHDPIIFGVSLILLAMPVGNSVVLFASEYGNNVSLAAKTVLLTTLFSMVSIPFIAFAFL